MARIFITGSATGLGLMTASLLAESGHELVLHARNSERAKAAAGSLPAAHAVVEGDVSTIRATKRLAEKANRHGPYDAVIRNVAIGYREPRRIETGDGLPHVFAINTLAPFILTALIDKPKRLVYLSSGLYRTASADLDDITWGTDRWDGTQAYSESKLHDVLLAFAVAGYWADDVEGVGDAVREDPERLRRENSNGMAGLPVRRSMSGPVHAALVQNPALPIEAPPST